MTQQENYNFINTYCTEDGLYTPSLLKWGCRVLKDSCVLTARLSGGSVWHATSLDELVMACIQNKNNSQYKLISQHSGMCVLSTITRETLHAPRLPSPTDLQQVTSNVGLLYVLLQ